MELEHPDLLSPVKLLVAILVAVPCIRCLKMRESQLKGAG